MHMPRPESRFEGQPGRPVRQLWLPWLRIERLDETNENRSIKSFIGTGIGALGAQLRTEAFGTTRHSCLSGQAR